MGKVYYNQYSPYNGTKQQSWYLDYWSPRPIGSSVDDELMYIPLKYEYRPDLLSMELYGDTRLWWIFAQVNMDVIKDPIWDFKFNTPIYVPTKQRIQRTLGV